MPFANFLHIMFCLIKSKYRAIYLVTRRSILENNNLSNI